MSMARWFYCPQAAPKHHRTAQARHTSTRTGWAKLPKDAALMHSATRSLQYQPPDPAYNLLCHPSNFCLNSAPSSPLATRTRSTALRSLNGTAPPPPRNSLHHFHMKSNEPSTDPEANPSSLQSCRHHHPKPQSQSKPHHTPLPLRTPHHHIPSPLWYPPMNQLFSRPTLELVHPSKGPLQVNQCTINAIPSPKMPHPGRLTTNTRSTPTSPDLTTASTQFASNWPNWSSLPASKAQSLDRTPISADPIHTCKLAPELNTTRYDRTSQISETLQIPSGIFLQPPKTVPPYPVPQKHPKPHVQNPTGPYIGLSKGGFESPRGG